MSIAIVGNGGQGREVKSYFDKIGMESVFFVSDDFHNGFDGVMKLSELDIEKYHVLVCIADCVTKEKIVQSLPKETKYFTFIHPSAQVYTEHPIGKGSIICPNVVIGTNAKIGNHVLVNYNTTIGHDTVVDNFSTVNPNTAVSGNCKLSKRVFIGSSASVREKIEISEDVTVGMGSTVISNITKSGVYVGTPAREIIKR